MKTTVLIIGEFHPDPASSNILTQIASTLIGKNIPFLFCAETDPSETAYRTRSNQISILATLMLIIVGAGLKFMTTMNNTIMDQIIEPDESHLNIESETRRMGL